MVGAMLFLVILCKCKKWLGWKWQLCTAIQSGAL